jgi:hypothetical protein
VQIGAYDFSGYDTLGSIAVTFSDVNRSKCLRTTAGTCSTSVIFESGELTEFDDPFGCRELSARCQQFTNGPRSVDANGFAIEEPQPGATRSLGIREPVPEDLHPSADGKNDGTVTHCTMQALALFKLSSRLNLRPIFATANKVQIGRIGDWFSRVDRDVFDWNSAPFEATRQHESVSSVAVCAEKVGVERNNPHR